MQTRTSLIFESENIVTAVGFLHPMVIHQHHVYSLEGLLFPPMLVNHFTPAPHLLPRRGVVVVVYTPILVLSIYAPVLTMHVQSNRCQNSVPGVFATFFRETLHRHSDECIFCNHRCHNSVCDTL